MIIEIRIKNSFAFTEEVKLSLSAYVKDNKPHNIFKVAGIYGENNVGKTCLLKTIRAIKNVILGNNDDVHANFFSDNNISELGVTFLEKGKKYAYDFKYDVKSKEFIYESFFEIIKDSHNNEKQQILLIRDYIEEKYEGKNESLCKMLPVISKSSIVIHLLDESPFKELEEIKNILTSFANKIDVVDMNNIPISNTINLIKNKGDLQQKVVNFIKNADLDLEDFGYSVLNDQAITSSITKGIRPEEKALDLPDQIMDQIRLYSVYNGV